MKYLLLLFPILLTSCMPAESSHKADRQAKVELNALGIKQDLTPEEQGYPKYRTIKVDCQKGLEVYMTGAIACNIFQKREDRKVEKLNENTMQIEMVDEYTYYNYINDYIRYRIVFDSGAIGYYRLQNNYDEGQAYWTLDDDSDFFIK